MNHNKSNTITRIPTNIITGFLGVGKTTAILSLLKSRVTFERWAVLVNEFGEVGIDGSLFNGQYSEDSGVFIREVAGGCMCCAAGLPMHIALNQILARAKPQRLLIEPTGLGHPKEVLQVLSEAHYHDILDIQKTITLVDARKLRDSQYTSNDTFNQQIEIADTVVGNKQDLYQSDEREQLNNYVKKRCGRRTNVVFTQNGSLSPALLKGSSAVLRGIKHAHLHSNDSAATPFNEQPLPECGYSSVSNAAEGFEAIGWRFASDKIFNHNALARWLSQLSALRVKAVVITDAGVMGYNRVDDTITVNELDDCIESRIEIIATHIELGWQQQLMNTLLQNFEQDVPI